ncbi:Eukaryotic phosphomannomutase [Fusarium oxysporum f. sp. albedinis]|nr:Eukaryotic phosphomannomutase [Fusarium oxysporum f. sp. albedinis]
MEDLNEAGYTFGNPRDVWSIDQVKAGVEQLAALHASTWGYSYEDYPWITASYEGMMMALTDMWDDQIHGADRPPCPDIIKTSRERTVNAIKKHFATKDPKFMSLIHGDPHTGNIYLDKAGNPRALSVEDRRANEVAVIDHYLEALAKFGGLSLSTNDDDVMKEYAKATMAGMGWILTPYALQKKECVFPMCERYGAAIVDHKSIEIVEALRDLE